MSESTRHDKSAKGQIDPLKRRDTHLLAQLPFQIDQCDRDSNIGKPDQRIGNQMQPHQFGIAQVAVNMRQKVGRKQIPLPHQPREQHDYAGGKNRHSTILEPRRLSAQREGNKTGICRGHSERLLNEMNVCLTLERYGLVLSLASDFFFAMFF